MRPEFDGAIKQGREYIILSDVVGQGATLLELRYFIESSGGMVVGSQALTAGIFGGKLSINESTIKHLKGKFGDANLTRFLYDFNVAGSAQALTEKEGRFILRQSSLNALRDRIFEEAQSRNISLGAWKIHASVEVKYSKDDHIQGFTTADGKVYLVQGGIEKGKTMSVLAHELGVHAKNLGFKNAAQYQRLLRILNNSNVLNLFIGAGRCAVILPSTLTAPSAVQRL